MLEHSGASGIKVRIRRTEKNAHLSVEDNGVGIPAAEQGHIFERLYKGDASRSKEGSGLGPAITKKLAHALHGKIHVESEEGAGARFVLELECVEDL